MLHPVRAVATAGTLVLALLVGTASSAADQPDAAAVKPLITQDLPQIPGKEVTMLTVTYLPGGASKAHRHDAEVFVYVLEGAVVMQVDGHAPVTLKAGQTFHEGPSDVHRQSANASQTASAKFLVFMIKDKGKAATRPVPEDTAAH